MSQLPRVGGVQPPPPQKKNFDLTTIELLTCDPDLWTFTLTYGLGDLDPCDLDIRDKMVLDVFAKL